MRVVGEGRVHVYEARDECPHEPDSDELWQESWALFTWDPARGVFVLLRLGQEPNRGPGFSSAWINVWTPKGILKHTDDSIPLAPGDQTDTAFAAGGGLCRYEFDGNHHWAVDHEDVHLRLRMEDGHPGFGYWPEGSGSLAGEAAKNHIEATGTTTGSVTVRGTTYRFGGTAWRDHSWGRRNWPGFRSHRYYAALFGEAFSFFGVTMVGADGSMTRIGTIMRGDTVEATSDFDIVAFVGEDGVSNCGGRVTVLVDGETRVLDFVPFAKSVVSVHQDCVISDGMCEVTMGDLVGVGISECSNNAQGGTGRPAVFPWSKGVLENGLLEVES